MTSWLPAGVVVERQHQHRRRVGLQHQVVHRGQRVLAALLGDRRDRLIGCRLVVGRVADRVDAVGAVLDHREHRVEEHRRIRRQIRFGQDGRAHRRIGQAPGQLVAVQLGLQLAEGGPVGERVVSGEAEQHAERPCGDLGVELDAVLERLAGTIQHVPPQVREPGRLDHAERHRPLDLGRQPGHPVQLPHAHLCGALTGDAFRRHLEHRPAARGHRPARAEQLLLGRVRSGHRLAVDGAVALGA